MQHKCISLQEKMLRIIVTTALSFVLLTTMALSTTAQPPILDTRRQPLRTGFKYSIYPSVVDAALGLTLAARMGICRRYVVQNPGEFGGPTAGPNIPVGFKPFVAGSGGVIREGRDLVVTMAGNSTCVAGSTVWRVGEKDQTTARRFVTVGREGGHNYFKIVKSGDLYYNLKWCPKEVCPNCSFRCGNVGLLFQNRKGYLALYADPVDFVFIRQ